MMISIEELMACKSHIEDLKDEFFMRDKKGYQLDLSLMLQIVDEKIADLRRDDVQ